MSATAVNVAILGASGYTGAELIRLLLQHEQVHIQALTADRKAGQAISEVFPHLSLYGLPDLIKIDDLNVATVDVIFCALPHATTQAVIAALPRDKIVIDLSADFRLRDPALYEVVYGVPHRAVELQADAVYGLSEAYRTEISQSNLIACPGCFPTSAELPLLPLVRHNTQLIQMDRIIIDSKTGVTGAGRSLKEGNLFSEVAEGIHAYGVGVHRHAPEIAQELTVANGGTPVHVTFTPHLVPMNRGILSTIYVDLKPGMTMVEAYTALQKAYQDEPFVHVLPMGEIPTTRYVRGTNHCLIGLAEDRVPGRLVLVSVIDNLVKGSGGQAVQNMNIRLSYPETTGLGHAPLFP